MKKLSKATALMLSAVMLFGCTDNLAQSGVGDTTPPGESSGAESESKNDNSATESSVTDSGSISDSSGEENSENLVKNIEGYQTFSYDENKNELINMTIYTHEGSDYYNTYNVFEPTIENIKKYAYDSIEPVAIKCHVVGDSYYIYNGKCGDVQVMERDARGVYTPVIIDEILDNGGKECVYEVGDIVYINELYEITVPYKGSMPLFDALYKMTYEQYKTDSGDFTSEYYENAEAGFYGTIKEGNGKYIYSISTPVAMQKGESYLVFADNNKMPNENDGNIYAKNYHIIFNLEKDKPTVFSTENGDDEMFMSARCYRYQWNILKEKYGEHFKS